MTQPKSTSSSQNPARTETTKNSSAEKKKKLLQLAFKILQAEVYQNPRECDFRAGRTLVLLQELREFSAAMDNPKAEQEREQVEPKKPTQISEEGCHWLWDTHRTFSHISEHYLKF